MSLTDRQIALIHIAAKAVKLDDAQYRLLLSNVAGVTSSDDLDQAGFEDVMAVLEDMGWPPLKDQDYWRRKVSERGQSTGSRMAFKIRQLHEGLPYPLEALCRRFSEGRTDKLEELKPREAWKLIEGLKAMRDRWAEQRATFGPSDGSPSQPGLFG